MLHAQAAQQPDSHSSRSRAVQRIALSYSVFLLVCLALVLVLYTSTAASARRTYWDHQAAMLDTAVTSMSRDLSIMDNYARQLSTDSTFVRFASMEGLTEKHFIYTAYEVMQSLSPRQYGLMNLPVRESHILMKKSGYVISASQFTEARSYYKNYSVYRPDHYEEWLALLMNADHTPACCSLEPFTGRQGSAMLVQDMAFLTNRSIPATIWFELDIPAIERRFLQEDGAALLITCEEGTQQLALPASQTDKQLFTAMANATFGPEGMLETGRSMLIRREGSNGWIYTLSLPLSLCSTALRSYDTLFLLIFALALLLGVVMVIRLVKLNTQPIRQLDSQLQQAQGDNAEMRREMNAQRPALCMSYMRTLLSGHVSSNEEFAYMMHYLGLTGSLRHYVLFCIAHRQDEVSIAPAMADQQTLLEHIELHLDTGYPIYHYTTLNQNCVVLVTYDAALPNTLMDLQKRIVDLHNDLADHHDLWFYAGVGADCTQPNHLWESYEQARTASRYAGKNHIFLPYEFIRKDAGSWYYPMEISAKLLHFITTGNRQQVTEMFALIHRENLEERSLSVPLLNFLLSDLKNTLLKARFQVPPGQNDESLSRLDARLSEPPTFPQLESDALTLCGFFTSTAEPSDPIPEIERYLQDNFTDPSLCLSKLSDLFNISESYLSHLFKDRTGQNFSVYLENLRLNEAARRLSNRDCNLSTLYADLGYTNPTTLRRAFKKRFGITPSEMREQGGN